MSEKIYTWLLRLYPANFRETYGDDALQLFRDRWRDETGLFPRLRLWLDLLADLVVSLPRMQRHAGLSWAPAGTPSFHVLEDESLRLGAWLLGGALTLGAFGTGSFLIGHGGGFRAPNLNRGAAQQTGASGQPSPQNAGVPVAAAKEEWKLDAAERHRVIAGVIANLKQYYVYPDVAQKMADALLADERSGDYDAVTDGLAFADLLTRQLRDVSRDMHLEVIYSRATLPDRPPEPTPESLARYKTVMDRQNCTFETVEILPHNIGYLKLNSFPEPSICGPSATAAMAKLNQADAIVFDLRDNRGGYPSMVMLIGAYFFDHPEYMYNPRENTTEQSWTRSPVPGNRLADKPVYVLTSARTWSGAEHFSYDLKMLKRATLVGETTGGATDVGSFHRIDDHFGMGIRETRAINPFSKPDWAVTGVEPDVKVKASDALAMAQKLAESRLRNK
jgi:hypothetical protein